MSKHRRKKRIPVRNVGVPGDCRSIKQKEGKQSQRIIVRLLSRSWKLITILIALLAAIITLNDCLTRISVSCDSPLSPTHVFSTPFIIKNEGRFPIRDVELSCRLRNVMYKGGIAGWANLIICSMNPPITQINSGDSTTALFQNIFGEDVPIGIADIEILTEYRTMFSSIIPWFPKKQHRARFMTKPTADGKLRWVHKSVYE